MSAQVSRAALLWAIIRKDLLEYSRERFFVVITVIGILFYALAFWLLPSSVNESFTVGIRQTGMDAIFTEAMGDQSAGIEIVQFESIEALEAALGVGDAEPEVPLAIGLAFPTTSFRASPPDKKQRCACMWTPTCRWRCAAP